MKRVDAPRLLLASASPPPRAPAPPRAWRGRLLAELHVGVGDVLGLVEDDERRGAARQQQQGDGDAGLRSAARAACAQAGHAALGYRRRGILERLRRRAGPARRGGEPGVWLVGGAVRDALLGREPRELDLVVEGDAPRRGPPRGRAHRRRARRARALRHGHRARGRAGARPGLRAARARHPGPGALPEVELGATIEEDSARRDFTVNAIAVALADGTLAQVAHAEEDLRAGRLRVLHDASFADDPTRLLRLARYAARLGWPPSLHTAALAAAAGSTASAASASVELRLLLEEPQPAALEAPARYAPALLPGLDPDPDRIAAVLAAAPPDARRDLLALAAAWPPDDERLLALGFPAADRRSSAPARAPARSARRSTPRPCRRPCGAFRGASPSRSPSSRAGSGPGDGSPSGATCGRRSAAWTC